MKAPQPVAGQQRHEAAAPSGAHGEQTRERSSRLAAGRRHRPARPLSPGPLTSGWPCSQMTS